MPQLNRLSNHKRTCCAETVVKVEYEPPSCPLTSEELTSLEAKFQRWVNYKLQNGISSEIPYVDYEESVLDIIERSLTGTPKNPNEITERELIQITELCYDKTSQLTKDIWEEYKNRVDEMTDLIANTIPYMLAQIQCKKGTQKSPVNVLGGGNSEYDFLNNLYVYFSFSNEDVLNSWIEEGYVPLNPYIKEVKDDKYVNAPIDTPQKLASYYCMKANVLRPKVPVGLVSSIDSLIENGELSLTDKLKLAVNPNIRDLFKYLNGDEIGIFIPETVASR